jgi:hypothetical protein
MLRRARNVIHPTPLAAWTEDVGQEGGNIVIRLEGVDPRLLLVPRLWIERPAGIATTNMTGVTWSLYSAGEDSRGGTIALHAADGAFQRIIGPEFGEGYDGIVQAGDNLEINAATDVLIVAACVSVPNIGGQILWFALDAFPAETSLTPEDYDGLLAAVKAQIPPCITIAGSS